MARRSAIKARTQAINQLHALVVTAPDQIKHQLGNLSAKALVKVCAAYRPNTDHTTITYTKKTLRLLARRYQALTSEIEELNTEMHRLCVRANPALLAAPGVGPDTASALLVTAGDNPHRMQSQSILRSLVRHKSRPSVLRTDHTTPSQPRWQPPSQQRALAHRIGSYALPPGHHRIRPKTPDRRQNPPRDHPLPEKAHRPRDPPPAHQPTTNPQRHPPTRPTPKNPDHPHPRRPSAPNPPHPPLTTRTRHPTQPPTRHPIPTLAHPPPSIDL